MLSKNSSTNLSPQKCSLNLGELQISGNDKLLSGIVSGKSKQKKIEIVSGSLGVPFLW